MSRRNRPVWRMYAVTTRDIPLGNIAPCELCSVLPLDYMENGDVCDDTIYCAILLVPFAAGMTVSTLLDEVLAEYRPMSYQMISQVWEVAA